MHRNSSKLLADHLTLARVNAGANVDAEFPDRVHNCPPAADRTRRTIKRRQETVTGIIYFATSMPRELATNKGVMWSNKVFPFSVTNFDEPICCANNVRE